MHHNNNNHLQIICKTTFRVKLLNSAAGHQVMSWMMHSKINPFRGISRLPHLIRVCLAIMTAKKSLAIMKGSQMCKPHYAANKQPKSALRYYTHYLDKGMQRHNMLFLLLYFQYRMLKMNKTLKNHAYKITNTSRRSSVKSICLRLVLGYLDSIINQTACPTSQQLPADLEAGML